MKQALVLWAALGKKEEPTELLDRRPPLAGLRELHLLGQPSGHGRGWVLRGLPGVALLLTKETPSSFPARGGGLTGSHGH